MSEGWYIAFGAMAGVFAFVGQCTEDAIRLGWKPYWAAFAAVRPYRRSMLVQLLSCMCGGGVFGVLVAAFRILLD
jgi:hypothetical protein